jgi:sugar lactone lactonase YvrE
MIAPSEDDMSDIHPFKGSVLSSHSCELGEGPTYDPHTNTAWWFNILGRELHELNVATGESRVHALPFLASVLARIDGDSQLLATDQGLVIRSTKDGTFRHYVALEPEKPGNRSNDGRVHPSGSLWIGTMGRKAEDGAGSIYHVAKGVVTPLFGGISIPNSICFSPDGSVGYYVDTRVNRIMRVSLDPATGLPTGDASIFIDTVGQQGGTDGSVCDADGLLWNARWGASAVDCYAPDGRHLARHSLPTKRGSCPAFFGPKADRMMVTTAWEGADETERAGDPQCGFTFDLGISVNGRFEPDYRL